MPNWRRALAAPPVNHTLSPTYSTVHLHERDKAAERAKNLPIRFLRAHDRRYQPQSQICRESRLLRRASVTLEVAQPRSSHIYEQLYRKTRSSPEKIPAFHTGSRKGTIRWSKHAAHLPLNLTTLPRRLQRRRLRCKLSRTHRFWHPFCLSDRQHTV